MSEITPNIAAFVAIAGAGLGVLTNPRDNRLGLLLGGATALVIAGTRNGWPMAAPIAAVLLVRIVGRRGEDGSGWTFWTGFAAPTLLLFGLRILSIPVPFYEQWRFAIRPETLMSRTSVVATTALIAVGGASIEWLLAGRGQRPSRAIRVLAWSGAGWMGAMLLLSAFVELPRVQPIETVSAAGPLAYVQHVLTSALSQPRVSGADFLLWTSFVGGFGWIDTLLPQSFVASLTIVLSAAAIYLLVHVARNDDPRLGTGLLLIAGGVLVGLIGCALGAYGLQRNVHGRYMIGNYLVILALLGALPLWAKLGRVRSELVVLAVALAGHAVALSVIASRYFG
jgi:hypothetical protein